MHIVGGHPSNGAFQGANILHEALIEKKINSKILNDTSDRKFQNEFLKKNKNVIFVNDSLFKVIKSKFYVILEKLLKSFFLHSPRDTFTLSMFGYDISKIPEYEKADILHFHWLSDGFINIKSFSKIGKPVVWTMRDMWAFTSGAHYEMDFKVFEKSFIASYLKKIKKLSYKKNFKFVAPSNWLKNKAQKSYILKNFNLLKINNNVEIKKYKHISKTTARSKLKINTKKKIILYGAQNPQSKRKGWKIFLDVLKKLNKNDYFLLIFGNFWSDNLIKELGIEYINFGYIKEIKKLNLIYSSADIFIATSIEDAWPKTFAESMCCGTPVVCFDKTSISEIVDHKLSGYIVKNFNSEELKKGIEWLCKNVCNKKIKLNNIRKKISTFDSKLIAKKYIKLYETFLNK